MDVSLFNSPDGGEISVSDGVVLMTGGLETAVYLSLFGGNLDDSGLDGDPLTWWGNASEENPVNQYRGRTDTILGTTSATPAAIRTLQDAVLSDLLWLTDENIASSVEVVVSIPALNRAHFEINIDAFGRTSSFQFSENWALYQTSGEGVTPEPIAVGGITQISNEVETLGGH